VVCSVQQQAWLSAAGAGRPESNLGTVMEPFYKKENFEF
jgi:hypothetical protein